MDHSLTPGPSVTVLLDRVCFKSKPGNAGLGAITNRLKAADPVTLSASDFAEAIRRGQAWCGALYDTKPKDWRNPARRQVLALDFDGEPTYLDPLDALERCTKLGHEPLMLYTTFSHTDEHPRFRIVFRLEPEYSPRDFSDGYSRVLLHDFPEADQVTGNANRIFLGSGGEVWPCWPVYCAEGGAA